MKIITTADGIPTYILVWDGVPATILGTTHGMIHGITVMAAGMAGVAPGITADGHHPGIMVGIAPGAHLGIMGAGTILGITEVIGAVVVTTTVSMMAITVV